MTDTLSAPAVLMFEGREAQYRSTSAVWSVEGAGDRDMSAQFRQHEREYPNGSGLASVIVAEAYALDLERRVEHPTTQPGAAHLTFEDSPAGTIIGVDSFDDLAAEAVAKGANDSQLGKLRDLIVSKRTAEREVTRLTGELATARRLATDDITDPWDSRVVDYWVQAARAAKRAGYCEVYDEIAGAVGIPTRSDLRDRGFNIDNNGTVTIAVSFSVEVAVENMTFDPSNDSEEYWVENNVSRYDIDRAAKEFIDSTASLNEGSYTVESVEFDEE